MKLAVRILFFINLFNSIFCVFKYIDKSGKFFFYLIIYYLFLKKYYEDTLDSNRNGTLNDIDFSFEQRSSVDGFPENLTVNATVLGHSIHTTFYKLDGFIAQASLSSQVLIKNDSYSEISQLESENLVVLSFKI